MKNSICSIILGVLSFKSIAQVDDLIVDGFVLAYHYHVQEYEKIESYLSDQGFAQMPDSKPALLMYYKKIDSENHVLLVVDKKGRIGITKASKQGSFYSEKVKRDIQRVPVFFKGQNSDNMFLLSIPKLDHNNKKEREEFDYIAAIEFTDELIWFYTPDKVNEEYNWAMILKDNL